jgi:Arc/MetJ-type ribon-helix-helix transcriptional regulator
LPIHDCPQQLLSRVRIVEEAVQNLIDEEADEHAHLDHIRARIEAAEAEIDRGDFVEFDENTVHSLAKEIHERGLKRLSAEQKIGTRG